MELWEAWSSDLKMHRSIHPALCLIDVSASPSFSRGFSRTNSSYSANNISLTLTTVAVIYFMRQNRRADQGLL